MVAFTDSISEKSWNIICLLGSFKVGRSAVGRAAGEAYKLNANIPQLLQRQMGHNVEKSVILIKLKTGKDPP
jgi:hypothetical protein